MKFRHIVFLFSLLCNYAYPNTIFVGLNDGKYEEKTSESIQRAIDDLAEMGGGVVELSEGVFTLNATVYLRSHIHLRGKGKKTILRKANIDAYSRLLKPVIKGETSVYVKDPQQFRVGGGVNIGGNNVAHNDTTLTKIVKIEGNMIYLEDPILFSCLENPYISGNFVCLFVYYAENVTISNLVIDGNRKRNRLILSWKIGGIKTWQSPFVQIRNLEIRETSGDGIILGTSDYGIIDSVYCHHTNQIAIHLGNNSKYPIVNQCICHDAGLRDSFNGAGIFFCIGIKNGIIRGNKLSCNRGGGISLGGEDSDNIFIDNELFSNEIADIRFRIDAESTCSGNIFLNQLFKEKENIVFEGKPLNLIADKTYANSRTVSQFTLEQSDIQGLFVLDELLQNTLKRNLDVMKLHFLADTYRKNLYSKL